MPLQRPAWLLSISQIGLAVKHLTNAAAETSLAVKHLTNAAIYSTLALLIAFSLIDGDGPGHHLFTGLYLLTFTHVGHLHLLC